ncbi:hypothetical protein N7520_005343 [Penicillium odoratum]|uniref:uncharacterized protein n=1 Tax=Penicillium odoratum TaxID=1167516 RepID=UPI002546B261|nr:uncharacterized protein N7520_005343 [Penicillium odoratum]KAJ5765784.1 hypothetical protein N7520_005343 [Penicillium odoratum]
MSYTDYCNCESIHVTLPQQPENSGLCHCDNCKRAGGGKSIFVVIPPGDANMEFSTAFSVNYFLPEDEMTLDDPKKALKSYEDSETASGNVIQRYFCSNCGSAIFTRTPKTPGDIFLKATLFDTVSPTAGEIFAHKKLQL